MKPSDALELHRAALRDLIRRHGFTRARVYGSVLGRSDTEDSDLDLLVDPEEHTTLFKLVALEDDACRLAGVRVSVLTPKFLSPKFRDRILREAEAL